MCPTDDLLTALDRDGIVLLPDLISGVELDSMCAAFVLALTRLRLNEVDGYHKTERLRDMVDDILLLDQGFLNLGLNPHVTEIVRRYVGPQFQLVECKGWRSRPTAKDWHGWHADAWYDQGLVDDIPRELKLGVYLSDVRSGGFVYLKGSHRKVMARSVPRHDIGTVWQEEQVPVDGRRGTAFLFDTSGIHRQSVPILEPRMAAFYCYHDASLALQAEDIEYGRYHPLVLNAAFLGGLSTEQQRILGFGDTRNFGHRQRRRPIHPLLDGLFTGLLETSLVWDELTEPLQRRVRSLSDRFRKPRESDNTGRM